MTPEGVDKGKPFFQCRKANYELVSGVAKKSLIRHQKQPILLCVNGYDLNC
jgi:hypothetical protein